MFFLQLDVLVVVAARHPLPVRRRRSRGISNADAHKNLSAPVAVLLLFLAAVVIWDEAGVAGRSL